ncbi:MAG: putative porphobilinogen deaminase [Chlamydiales bacterium]|jgi:uroporphyrinogen-III synthase|nr:putative porphobilinogen deaminase [Chlamydiales bacterium]
MRSLYLGLDESKAEELSAVHYPVIRLEPVDGSCQALQQGMERLASFSHLLFTSKPAVHFFWQQCLKLNLSEAFQKKPCFAIGQATARALESLGCQTPLIAKEECLEGIIALFSTLNLTKASFFWPHSARSRTILVDFWRKEQISFYECCLYYTLLQKPYDLDVSAFDRLIFTSPSTVDGFLALFKEFPIGCQLQAIGPVTGRYLAEKLEPSLFLLEGPWTFKVKSL